MTSVQPVGLSHSPLFEPLTLGAFSMPNRIVMAPLTRMRAAPGEVPTRLMALQYAQRASAGLIISEATQIEPGGQGYPDTPGIFNDAQTKGWAGVTDAVHAMGGRMLLQLWHVGRISHSSFQPDGRPPVAPSAIAPRGTTMTKDWGRAPFETPRALEEAEIPGIVRSYAAAAKRARSAGFDGVEVHGANGYLLDQFLHDGVNTRADRYGGPVSSRVRLLLEVVDAVCAEWGAARVGVRLSPWGTSDGMHDSDTKALFAHAIGELARRQLAYIHLIEPRSTDSGASEASESQAPSALAEFGHLYPGRIMTADGYTPSTAAAAVSSGLAAAVAFGRLFISNPDLPLRIWLGAPLAPYRRETFYGGDAAGYTDYPFLAGLDGAPSATSA